MVFWYIRTIRMIILAIAHILMMLFTADDAKQDLYIVIVTSVYIIGGCYYYVVGRQLLVGSPECGSYPAFEFVTLNVIADSSRYGAAQAGMWGGG